MLATDGIKRLVETNLARGIASQFNLVDNNLLRLASLMILRACLMLQNVISSARSVKEGTHACAN